MLLAIVKHGSDERTFQELLWRTNSIIVIWIPVCAIRFRLGAAIVFALCDIVFIAAESSQSVRMTTTSRKFA